MARTAILIRTKNESHWLPTVFERLRAQTDQNFEVIVIDSGSTDETVAIASRAGARVIQIQPEEFSYPHALNIGATAAPHDAEFLLMLSAHSLPVGVNWLASALAHFSDETVAGVYGPTRPLPHATFWDHVFMDGSTIINFFRRPGVAREYHANLGTLGFTNAVIRKLLWNEHHFDESFGAGGEDSEWAAYWMARGKCVIFDRAFVVQHSHNLGLYGWLAQHAYWRAVSHPGKFQRLAFRRDAAHR